MVHQRERLPLRFKPGDDAFGVHARLDDFQGHPPPNGLLLFGQVNDPATAFADLRQQPVSANETARPLTNLRAEAGSFHRRFSRKSPTRS